LLEAAPIFFDILLTTEDTVKSCTAEVAKGIWCDFYNLLRQIVKKLKATILFDETSLYENISKHQYQEIYRNLPVKHEFNSDLDELWSTGCYFPNRRIYRKIKEMRLESRDNISPCAKQYNQGASCAPGVVLFYCVKHECCIGFVVLDRPESPKLVYEILMTRFKEAPKIVIYDNGCNLQEYVLNRTPILAQNMRILVDGFHYQSHVNCAPTFDTHAHPPLTNKLNTSLFEQRNSRLAPLKNTAPLLNIRTFLTFLRYAVGSTNIQQHQKIKGRNKKE
jgi:hypothetical protein